MNKVQVSSCIIMASILLTGCGVSQNPYTSAVRPARDAPDQFNPAPSMVLDDSCKSPMIDPRDGTELIMVSSQNGVGLYQVAEMKYGLSKGECLKLNCSTGKVLGIVKMPK